MTTRKKIIGDIKSFDQGRWNLSSVLLSHPDKKARDDKKFIQNVNSLELTLQPAILDKEISMNLKPFIGICFLHAESKEVLLEFLETKELAAEFDRFDFALGRGDVRGIQKRKMI